MTAVRDQLWAEAAVREATGEAIFLSPEIEAMARLEQAKRFDPEERQQMLEDLLEGQGGFVPNDDLYKASRLREKKDRHPGNAKIVNQAMTRLKWTQCVVGQNRQSLAESKDESWGASGNRFQDPHYDGDLTPSLAGHCDGRNAGPQTKDEQAGAESVK